MKNFRFFILLIILTEFLGFGRPVSGEEAPASEPTVNERIQTLDQKVQDLEKRLDSQKESGGTNANVTALGRAGKEGFILKSADGDYVLKFKTVLQLDGYYFVQDNQGNPGPGTSTFNPRKARLYVEGTLDQYYDFRLLPDFGNGQTVLQDGYLDIHYWPQYSLKAGKYKSPFGLERLQDETNLIFFDRALPTDLAPNRDVGFVLHGDPWGGAFSYALGVLNGVADGAIGDTDINNDKDGVARIFARPFKGTEIASLSGLGIGVAGTYGNQQRAGISSPNLPFYITIGQKTFFSYRSDGTVAGTVVANGKHARYSPQAYYYWRSFGLLGEYSSSAQDVTRGSNSTTLTHTAWQAAISFILTGETASYDGVDPINIFDPRKGKWGALELKVRYSQLDIDNSAFPIYADPAKSWPTAREWGGGLNWYLNRNIKVQLDYFDTSFDVAPGGVSLPDEKVALTRFQLAF